MTVTLFDEILEGTTPNYIATLKDEGGVVIAGSVLSAARLTFTSLHSGATINGREDQDILNDNSVAITQAGAIIWKLLEADVILADTPKPDLGHHVATFVFEWLDIDLVPRKITHVVMIPIRRVLNAPWAAGGE